jgi:radical SAM protein with 4Fe4S-binding SPASM domain
MPFCYSPWSNIDISPQGDITPCCKFQTQYYKQKFNIRTQTIEQYANSKFLIQLKQEFQHDIWPKGCERCQIEEENNIKSKRQLDYDRWQEHYQQYNIGNPKFITSSIAFGNTCNLTCITCNSESSSRWQKEYQHITGIDIVPHHFYKENFVGDLVKQAPNLIHIDIPGGEPFLSGVNEQKELLNYYIENNQAQNISLHYTTNAMIFPDQDWWYLWQHFKEVDIQLSIDGIGSRYEYIRYPGKWKELVNSVEQYIQYQTQKHNIRLSVSHTVSAYNIFYLDEFIDWNYNIGLPRPWLGRVHNPVHMRPSVWTTDAKKLIIEKLSNSKHTDVKIWSELISNTDDSNHYELFCQRLAEHDQYRGTNFKQVFPELANYI